MTLNICRRRFLAATAGCCALAAADLTLAQTSKDAAVTTITYKRVKDLEIKADILYPAGSGPFRPLVWIHGGALIMGNRIGIDGRLKKLALDAGYAIVSIDYRLAPETKLPEVVAD